jgi:hypothetical protein
MFKRIFGAGAALGAGLAYFFDPDSGRRRRHELVDRTAGAFRRGGRRAERAGRAVGAQVYGMSQQVQHRHEVPKDFDDATLARKVETEIFRPADVPKGQIVVNVQDGVVQLRGEVDGPELISELVEKARSVQGVRDVENLLHVPGTPAPMHQ